MVLPDPARTLVLDDHNPVRNIAINIQNSEYTDFKQTVVGL